jgi:protein-tyrosine phosphatase
MAEALFRNWLDPNADAHVASAGTEALVGSRVDDSSAAVLARIGLNPTHHRAQLFEPWMARAAHLVLTAEIRHRDVVMTAAPAAFRRTFTMREFARLARHLHRGDPVDVVAQAATIRGIDGAQPEGADDVLDPFRESTAKAQAVLEQIAETVYTTLDVLGLLNPAVHGDAPTSQEGGLAGSGAVG